MKFYCIFFYHFVGRSDPFVIVRVGTSKQEKYKTKVVYRTLNPVWNEQITLAMPQKHERVAIEVWDKDPLTQERLGSTHFNHDDLIHLGANENDKHWFDLDKAKSGEIQLQFAVTMPTVSLYLLLLLLLLLLRLTVKICDVVERSV